MAYMFYGASAFNQPLSLDTSSVTSMEDMFFVRAVAPNLQQSPSLHAACTTTAPTALSAPGPHLALLHVTSLRPGRPRGSSTSR